MPYFVRSSHKRACNALGNGVFGVSVAMTAKNIAGVLVVEDRVASVAPGKMQCPNYYQTLHMQYSLKHSCSMIASPSARPSVLRFQKKQIVEYSANVSESFLAVTERGPCPLLPS